MGGPPYPHIVTCVSHIKCFFTNFIINDINYIFIFARNARKFMRKLHENTFPPVPFTQFTIVNFRNFNDNIISFQKIHNFEHHGDKRYGANAFFSGRPQRGPGKPQSEQPSYSLF